MSALTERIGETQGWKGLRRWRIGNLADRGGYRDES